MMDTYKSGEAQADREAQLRLVDALGAWSPSLRRDECGAWRITGSHGHIYTWGDGSGYLLHVASGSARKWSADQKRLAFCKVTQNGDDEGCVRLIGLPTADQAIVIRDILGIRKRREDSTQTLEASKARCIGWVSARISAEVEGGRYHSSLDPQTAAGESEMEGQS